MTPINDVKILDNHMKRILSSSYKNKFKVYLKCAYKIPNYEIYRKAYLNLFIISSLEMSLDTQPQQ